MSNKNINMEAEEYIKATVYIADDYAGELTIPVTAYDIGDEEHIASLSKPMLLNAIEEHVEDYVGANVSCVVDPDGVVALSDQLVVYASGEIPVDTKLDYLGSLLTTLCHTRNVMGDNTYEAGAIDSIISNVEGIVDKLKQNK